MRRIKSEDIGEFNTSEEARENSYTQCKYCAPMGKYYRREYQSMKSCAVQNGLSFYLYDGAITIMTPHSKWKLITMGKKNRLHLLHKSTIKKEVKECIIPGYHSQSFYSPTIMGYMEFILEHDNYRLHNPGYTTQTDVSGEKRDEVLQ